MNTYAKILAATLGLALVGWACKEGQTGLRFSHELHAGEAECADCHRGESLRTGMEPCKECHEIDTASPSEACLQCHTRPGEEGYAVTATRKGRSYDDVRFDHAPHEEVGCETCHPGVSSAKTLGAITFPTMARCQTCHDGTQAPSECETCHETLRAGTRPPSHDPLWASRHGRTVEPGEVACGYCHDGRDPCLECHRQEKPRSHTLGWKVKSHGLEARHDRDNCAACHTATFCSDCHREAPRSHAPRNGWLAEGHRREGALDRDSCRVCHPRIESTCTPCHPGGY